MNYAGEQTVLGRGDDERFGVVDGGVGGRRTGLAGLDGTLNASGGFVRRFVMVFTVISKQSAAGGNRRRRKYGKGECGGTVRGCLRL